MFSLLAVAFLTITVAPAQIVNIDNPHLGKLKDGWSGEMNLIFSLTSNTRQIVQLGEKNKIHYRKRNQLISTFTDFSFVAVDKQNYVNNGFAHIRYAWNSKKYKKIFLEGFAQTQYNQIQLYKQRELLGAGSRALVIDKDSANVNVGAFIMGEYEQANDGTVAMALRYSCFLSFDFQFSKTTGINSITYYQPDFFYPGDYRLSTETSLRFNITEKLKFKLLYNLQYDSRPPTGAPKTIYYLQNAFGFSF